MLDEMSKKKMKAAATENERNRFVSSTLHSLYSQFIMTSKYFGRIIVDERETTEKEKERKSREKID